MGRRRSRKLGLLRRPQKHEEDPWGLRARSGSGGQAETWTLFISEALRSSLEFCEGQVCQTGVRDLVALVHLKDTCLQGAGQTEDPVPKEFAVNL